MQEGSRWREREEECEREKSELVSIQLIKQEPPYMRVREGGMEAGVRVSRSVIVYLEAKSSLTSKAKGERENPRLSLVACRASPALLVFPDSLALSLASPSHRHIGSSSRREEGARDVQ